MSGIETLTDVVHAATCAECLPDLPCGASKGIEEVWAAAALDWLPVLLREDSERGEALRARFGLSETTETVIREDGAPLRARWLVETEKRSS